MADLRIVFMGTPEFAVPSLEILCSNGFEIVGVITAPDKPKGRGQKIATSPVKEFAQDNGLKVLQPTNLKNDQFLKDLAELRANSKSCIRSARLIRFMAGDSRASGPHTLKGSGWFQKAPCRDPCHR